MKRGIFRWITAAVLAAMWASPVLGARLLIPVGEVVGLNLSEGTVTVAAFHETYGTAARRAGLQIGDEILSVEGRTVDCAQDLYDALKCSDGQVELELCRGGKTRRLSMAPAVTEEGPRLGVFVREGVSGIGTVTWYDPDTGKFAALGHGVSDGSGMLLNMTRGFAYEAKVIDIRRGRCGEPGQLRGAVQSAAPLGTLRANTAFGVFGTGAKWLGEALPVAEPGQVRAGDARILSNIRGDEVAFYDVQIRPCAPRESTQGRDLILHITDPALLEATGGIVAGMSGSPIIQDGRLVGAVTHVFVNDPTRGYGIFIENMLNAAT